jgi:hypothetical protein
MKVNLLNLFNTSTKPATESRLIASIELSVNRVLTQMVSPRRRRDRTLIRNSVVVQAPRFRGCRLDDNSLLPGPAKAGAWQIYGSTARFASGRVDHKYRI